MHVGKLMVHGIYNAQHKLENDIQKQMLLLGKQFKTSRPDVSQQINRGFFRVQCLETDLHRSLSLCHAVGGAKMAF